jgi:predicted nucleic acid-binding protein
LKPPAWLTIQQPISAGADLSLGPGERQAIALAQETHADYLLVDDLDARRHSIRLGLRIIGTVGVLELADFKSVAPLPVALDRLRQTDFIIAPQILDEALARWQQRQRSS